MIYLNCSSGISGDMFAGALIALGADAGKIRKALGGVAKIRVTKTVRGGVEAVKFESEFDPASREYVDLVKTIQGMRLKPQAEKTALKILRILAEAESVAHGVPLRRVHLHEAADCVVDAAAAGLAIDDLGLGGEAYVSSVVSCGYIAPATMHILRKYGIPVKFISDKELITPTGAAILAALVTEYRQVDCAQYGSGAGSMELPWPNVLDVCLVSEKYVIESNIDDCTPEHISHMMYSLMDAGALDVHVLPCMMKKGRLGFLVRVLTEHPREHAGIIMGETGTLGVRVVKVGERIEAQRTSGKVKVNIRGKPRTIRFKRSPAGIKGEFDDISSAAKAGGITFKKTRQLTEKALKRKV